MSLDQGPVGQAYSYFIGTGFTPAQAAGIVGNLEVESSTALNPVDQQNHISDSQTPIPNVGFGIAQWTTPGRQQNLVAFAHDQGLPVADPELQLEFITRELTISYPKVLTEIKQTNNPADAATIFMEGYEKPGKPNLANRIGFAQDVLEEFQQNQ